MRSFFPNITFLNHIHRYEYYITLTKRFEKPKIIYCGECKQEISSTDGPVYASCDMCDRDMHVSCLELPQDKFIPHFTDKHGYFIENSRKIKPQENPRCFACGEQISISNCPWYASCEKCKNFLHKSCIELSPQISDHPLHPHHNPLRLNYKNNSYCGACGMYCEGTMVYSCSECPFCIDVKCAMMLNLVTGDTVREHQLSNQKSPHWHQVILCRTSTKYCFFNDFCCGVCGQPFRQNGDDSYIYVCLECRLLMHISCVGFPQLIENNPFHEQSTGSQHPLILNLQALSYFCHACKRLWRRVRVSYICPTDDNNRFDFLCALLTKRQEFNIEDSQSRNDKCLMFEHSAAPGRGERPVIDYDMRQLPRIKFDFDCGVCHKPFKDIASYWPDRRHFVHKSCTELADSIINHPFHPQHPLNYGRESNNWARCHACYEFPPSYDCEICDFKLCVRCSREDLYPVIEDRFNHQKHSLSFFNFKRQGQEFNCSRCCREISTPFFRCVICNYNLHAHCLSNLPVTLKHNHLHTLTLTYLPIKDSFPDDDETAEFYCDCCEEIRDRCLPTYHCADCLYVAHVHCVITQVIDYLQKAPTSSEQLSDMELDTTTTNFLKLGTLLPLQVQHGFHLHHTLTLSDSLDIGEKKRFKCSICFKTCYNLGYVCNSCEFYVDLRCASLVSPPIIMVTHLKNYPCEFVSIQPCDSNCRRSQPTFDGPYFSCSKSDYGLMHADITKCGRNRQHTVDHHTHKHPLIYKFGCALGTNLRFVCDICTDWGDTSDPSYKCDSCKFIAHVRCVIDNEVAARCLGVKELWKSTNAALEGDADAKELVELFELDKEIVTHLAKAQQLKEKRKELTIKIEELKEETEELEEKMEKSKVSRSQLTASTSTTLSLLHQKKIEDVEIEFKIKEDAQNIACEEDERIQKHLSELAELKHNLVSGLSSKELVVVQQSK